MSAEVMLDDWRRQEEEFNAELAEAIGTISGYAAAAGEDAQAAERGVHRTNVALTAIAASPVCCWRLRSCAAWFGQCATW